MNTLYDEVVSVTYEYLGPAADRFVSRQIRSHLGKDPEKLRKQDLKTLIDWFSLALALLSEDTKLVKEYSKDLKNLTNGQRK